MVALSYSAQPQNQNRYGLLATSMSGRRPRFGLPDNFGFNDLADYEEGRRSEMGTNFQDQIAKLKTGVQSQYDTALGDFRTSSTARRSSLASSLSDSAKKTFEMNNPWILEDLNKRGVFTSPTAVATAQADALKEIELGNQTKLLDFDTEARNYENALTRERINALTGLEESGVAAKLQAEQDALDAALDLRRGKLEGDLAERASSREESLARDLADKSSRNQLTGALIGAGGSILGAGLEKDGFLSGLFPKGGGATVVETAGSAGAAGGGAGTSAAAGGSGLGLGGGLAIGGAGIAAALASRAAEKKTQGKLGQTGGEAAALATNPIGYQLNLAKELAKNPKASLEKLGKNLGIGKGKTADGNAIADLSRSVQSTQRQLLEFKSAVERGEISQEEYLAAAQPIVDETARAVGAMAGRGSTYANAINRVWQDFMNAGLARNTGNGFVAL